jgi:hypothetical protein
LLESFYHEKGVVTDGGVFDGRDRREAGRLWFKLFCDFYAALNWQTLVRSDACRSVPGSFLLPVANDHKNRINCPGAIVA